LNAQDDILPFLARAAKPTKRLNVVAQGIVHDAAKQLVGKERKRHQVVKKIRKKKFITRQFTEYFAIDEGFSQQPKAMKKMTEPERERTTGPETERTTEPERERTTEPETERTTGPETEQTTTEPETERTEPETKVPVSRASMDWMPATWKRQEV
jgi:hypothetical protein